MKTCFHAFVCVVLGLVMAGCASHDGGSHPAPTADDGWGSFSGRVRAEFDDNGRDMILLDDFHYTDPRQVVWSAPKGSRVNGASIPRAFWSVIGGPFEGRYRDASVIHDVACVEKSRPWREVHRAFYHGMRCRGVPERKAKTMYYAVFRFGPRWGPGARDGRAPTTSLGTGPESFSAVTPPQGPSSPEEVEAWIESENPTLEEIERS